MSITTKQKKYKINELLNKLTVSENKKAISILPAQLGIHPNTFNTYRNLTIDDKSDIPHTIVVLLECFFSLKPGELQNFRADIRPLKDLDNNQLELDLVKKFGMSKKPKVIYHDTEY